MKSLINTGLAIIVLLLAANLVFNACKKEADVEIGSQTNQSTQRTNDSDLAFEVTDANGNCFVVSLKRNADNSVELTKIPVPCSSDNQFGKRLTFAFDYQIVDGSIPIPNDGVYWYIPIDGGGSPEAVGGSFICRCEGGYDSEDPFCDNGIAMCSVETGSAWSSSAVYCTSVCCTDCDLSWCPEVLADCNSVGSGIVVEADTIIVTSQSPTFTVINDGIRLTAIDDGVGTTLIRTVLDGNALNSSTRLYNYSELNISNSGVDLPTGVSCWYIPFEVGGQPILVDAASGPGVECYSGTPPCSGDCDLNLDEAHPGCLKCDCSVSGGDCDMRVNKVSVGSGVILVSPNLSVIE
ncbi:MAG: hypothetical protein R2792_14490 [Saprospiraceae bacterium]